jgi:hypothetical protein
MIPPSTTMIIGSIIFVILVTSSSTSPSKTSATLARIESQEGRLEDAFNLLSEQYNKISNKESLLAKKLADHLYSIKAQIDLNCLNSIRPDIKCSLKDFEGNSYIKPSGKYIAIKSWSPFKIKLRKKI